MKLKLVYDAETNQAVAYVENGDERVANLFIAAPEMYDALKIAEAELENSTAPGINHIITAVRDAIRSAEGRQ